MSLTKAVRAGALDVFGLLYDEHGARVYAYCRAMVGDDAVDVMRAAFAGATRHRGSAPADEALDVWLYGQVREECLHRGALTRRPPFDPAAEPLWRAVAQLRPEHREALILSATFEPAEIGRILGVAPDTAELLVRTSRRRLEQALVSVFGGAADDELLAALGAGTLHKLLVKRTPEPPASLRRQVLAASVAARQPAGGIVFDQDGRPMSLAELFDPAAEALTRPLPAVTVEAVGSPADSAGANVTAAAGTSGIGTPGTGAVGAGARDGRPRRRDGLVAPLCLAACVVAATWAFAFWPGDGGASKMDDGSVLVHRNTPAKHTGRPPMEGFPQVKGSSPAVPTPSAAIDASPAAPAPRQDGGPATMATPGVPIGTAPAPVPTPTPSTTSPAPSPVPSTSSLPRRGILPPILLPPHR